MPYDKPMPEPGEHTGVFWEGAKAGKLMLPRCADCSRVHWYPRLICPYCHSMNIEWIEGSGQIRVSEWGEAEIVIAHGDGHKSDEADEVKSELHLLLTETAAWRAYYRRMSIEQIASIARDRLIAQT